MEPVMNARISARVDVETSDLIKAAAIACGVSLSSFMISTLRQKATQVMQEQNTLKLSEEASIDFIEKLNNYKPNSAMQAAMEEYDKLFGDSQG